MLYTSSLFIESLGWREWFIRDDSLYGPRCADGDLKIRELG